jgi:hypothetical protein
LASFWLSDVLQASQRILAITSLAVNSVHKLAFARFRPGVRVESWRKLPAGLISWHPLRALRLGQTHRHKISASQERQAGPRAPGDASNAAGSDKQRAVPQLHECRHHAHASQPQSEGFLQPSNGETALLPRESRLFPESHLKLDLTLPLKVTASAPSHQQSKAVLAGWIAGQCRQRNDRPHDAAG